MSEVRKPVSLNPDDFVAGGIISDVDVEFKSIRFCLWDYGGKITESVLAARAELVSLDGHNEEHEQYWSAGADFIPSEDGKTLVPTGEAAYLRKNSNFAMLVNSLKSCGMDTKALAAGDLSVLDGLQAHVVQAPAPKRTGLPSSRKEGGREDQVLIVSKIIKLPWEKKGARKPAASTAAAAASTPAAPGGGDETGAMVAALQAAVNVGDTIAVKTLKMALFKALSKEKSRNQMVTEAVTEAFLGEHGFMLDGENVTRVE